MASIARFRMTSALAGGFAPFLLLGLVAPAHAQAPTSGTSAPDSSTAPLGQTPNTVAPATPDKADTDNNAIIVTGTMFRNKVAASASPIVTISASDMTARGINTVSDALQKLSSNNAGTLATNWSPNGFATGASAPSLRGLNDQYTLTVFDNLRSADYPLTDDGYRNFVDINTIPDSIVDHIDVLQDGASASYGSDAIAGVVNIVIKKQIQGFHANVSGAISGHHDFGEQRADATYGYGDLASQGFNFWVNGEYQHNDPLYVRDRGFPYNTADLSSICGVSNGLGSVAAGSTTCANNGVVNGVQADGTFGGLGATPVGVVQPGDASGNPIDGSQYQLLNPAAGCQNLKPYTLTAAQQTANPTAPSTVCQEDRLRNNSMYDPEIKRYGANARLTVDIGSRAQAYAMFNFYEIKTANTAGDTELDGDGGAANNAVYLDTPLILPAYVCPRGTTIACTATNGTLNPNDPFAAQGETALLRQRYDQKFETDTNARTFRGSAGINGSFGDGWNYNADFTTSRVLLDLTYKNAINLQNLLNAIADGSYNFVDQSANSAAERQYIAPTDHVSNSSSLTQVQATLSKSFFRLPGGQVSFLVGGAYRKESIREPSANPLDPDNPYNRYDGNINPIQVIGGRNVKSGFFEIDAPVLKSVDLKAQGRYDDYSTGQTNFSPKFEATFQPIRQVKFRGTFSKGFRVPSFQQAFGSPSTGYITAQNSTTDPNQAAFIAAHNGDAYATQAYSVGLTGSGNPSLKPEKSTQWTAGIVLTPTSYLTISADYYNIVLKDLIGTPASCANTTSIIAQYYANNGVVNAPGCTVIGQASDPNAPNALPLIGDIASVDVNSATEKTRGIDLSATLRLPITRDIRWTSTGTATYIAFLGENLYNPDGSITKQRFDGSLGPCNITSCSGTPKWRATWENTIEYKQTAVTLTAYYTAGYQNEAEDVGGTIGNCNTTLYDYSDGSTPLQCHTKSFLDFDFTITQKVGDKFTIYANVLNVFNAHAPYSPDAAYSIYQFNPAWADQGFVGRYFRVGAKIDL